MNPRPDSCLLTYVAQQYTVVVIADTTENYKRKHITAVRALARAMGRLPRVSDLTLDNIDAMFSEVLRRGVKRNTAKAYRHLLQQQRRHLFPNADQQPAEMPAKRKWKGRKLTLEKAYWTIYLPFIEATAAESTLHSYKSALKKWDQFGAPSRDIRHLVAGDFVRLIRAIEPGLSPASVNSVLRHIRSILRFCEAEGVLDRVPRIRPVRVPEKIKPRPTFDQVGEFYAATHRADLTWPHHPAGPAAWWQAFIVLAFIGGLRKSELLALRWTDVGDEGIEMHRQKTAKLTFIPRMEVIDRHLQVLRDASYADRDFVLSAASSPRNLYREFKKIGKASGVIWTPHAFRRAAVDNWTNLDPLAGQIIGHSTLHVAFRHYLDKRAYLKGVAERLPIPESMLAPNA